MAQIVGMKNSTRVKKLAGLHGATENLIKGIIVSKKSVNVHHLIFSDNIDYHNGERLVNFIKEHKLGKITETNEMWNPNTINNTIKGWIWTINWKNMKKWYDEKATNLEDYERIY